jgi:hypothetical protein
VAEDGSRKVRLSYPVYSIIDGNGNMQATNDRVNIVVQFSGFKDAEELDDVA